MRADALVAFESLAGDAGAVSALNSRFRSSEALKQSGKERQSQSNYTDWRPRELLTRVFIDSRMASKLTSGVEIPIKAGEFERRHSWFFIIPKRCRNGCNLDFVEVWFNRNVTPPAGPTPHG